MVFPDRWSLIEVVSRFTILSILPTVALKSILQYSEALGTNKMRSLYTGGLTLTTYIQVQEHGK